MDDVWNRDRNVKVELSDGTSLACSVYKCGSGPAPVVVDFYPYHKDAFIGSLWEYTRREFAASGYTTVLVDFRGTGRSSGDVIEAFNNKEGDDAREVVEWLTRQDWCDGNVAIMGISYGAITALKVAADRPAGLKAIVPFVGTRNVHSEFLFPSQMPNALGRSLWATLMLTLETSPSIDHAPSEAWREVWAEHLARFETADLAPLAWLKLPKDADWADFDVDVTRVDVPTFLIGGWADVYPNCLDDFRLIRAPKRAVVGPWTHGLPDNATKETWDWQPEVLAWLDQWMRPGDSVEQTTAEPDEVLAFVGGADVWRSESEWPPTESRTRSLLLSGHHTLATAAEDVVAGIDQYVGDPTVGACGPLMDPMGTGFGYPLPQERDAGRSLVYKAPPEVHAVDITGRAQLDLHVECLDEGAYDLVAKLHDVGPDGTVHFIAAGYVHVLRDSVTSSPVESVAIQFNDTAYRIAPGHSIQISIAMADFPYVFPMPDNKTVRIHHTHEHPSVLTLRTSEPKSDDKPGNPVTESRLPWLKEGTSHWNIETDPLADGVAHTYGFSQKLDLPNGATYEWTVSGQARVTREFPADAVVDCTVSIQIHQSDGSDIHVTTSSQARRASFEFETTISELGGRWTVFVGADDKATTVEVP